MRARRASGTMPAMRAWGWVAIGYVAAWVLVVGAGVVPGDASRLLAPWPGVLLVLAPATVVYYVGREVVGWLRDLARRG